MRSGILAHSANALLYMAEKSTEMLITITTVYKKPLKMTSHAKLYRPSMVKIYLYSGT
jgi:hypothetical protein